MRVAATLALGVMLGCGTAQAAPVTMDFSSGTEISSGTLYVEDGFRIRPQGSDHFELGCCSPGGIFKWHDGSANNPPNILTIDKADGSGDAFDVLSLDITSFGSGVTSFLFSDSNGNTVNASTLGNTVLNFFNTTFLRFQSLPTGVNGYPNGIDNVVLNTTPISAVPLPAGLPLLAGGLGLMGFVGWRRKRKAATA